MPEVEETLTGPAAPSPWRQACKERGLSSGEPARCLVAPPVPDQEAESPVPDREAERAVENGAAAAARPTRPLAALLARRRPPLDPRKSGGKKQRRREQIAGKSEETGKVRGRRRASTHEREGDCRGVYRAEKRGRRGQRRGSSIWSPVQIEVAHQACQGVGGTLVWPGQLVASSPGQQDRAEGRQWSTKLG